MAPRASADVGSRLLVNSGLALGLGLVVAMGAFGAAVAAAAIV